MTARKLFSYLYCQRTTQYPKDQNIQIQRNQRSKPQKNRAISEKPKMKNQPLEKPPKTKSSNPEKLKSNPSEKPNPIQEKPNIKIFTFMKI